MILVTGSTGKVGQRLVGKLCEAGAEVRAFVRNPVKAKKVFAGLDVDVAVGNYRNPETLERAFEGCERAFVLVPPDHRQRLWNTSIVAAAGKQGARHLVRFSGIEARHDALSSLQRLHAASDDELIASGLRYTILRANSFYQNLFWSQALIQAKGLFKLPVGDGRQSLIDMEDVVDVAVRALTGDADMDQIYELTGPQALTYHEVASKLAAAVGSDVTYVPISPEEAISTMIGFGMPEWNAKAVVDLRVMISRNECARVTSTVEDVLGRPPRTFDQFAHDHRADFERIKSSPPIQVGEGQDTHHWMTVVEQRLQGEPHRTAGMTATYQFKVSGPRGADYFVEIVEGRPRIGKGVANEPDITIAMVDDDFIAMVSRQTSGAELFMMGKMKVTGNTLLGMKAESVFG